MVNFTRPGNGSKNDDDFDEKKLSKFAKDYTLFDVIEGLFYEIKPIGYFFFSVVILRTTLGGDGWIKLSCVGILVFSLYIIYRRMVYRGLLG